MRSQKHLILLWIRKVPRQHRHMVQQGRVVKILGPSGAFHHAPLALDAGPRHAGHLLRVDGSHGTPAGTGPAAIAALLQQRTETLTDIPAKLGFFDSLPEYDTELFVHKKSKSDRASSLEMLQAALPALEAVETWDDEHIHDCLVSLAEKLEVKNAKLMWPVRIAATGTAVTPGGAVELCRILGKEETIRRLASGIEKLS